MDNSLLHGTIQPDLQILNHTHRRNHLSSNPAPFCHCLLHLASRHFRFSFRLFNLITATIPACLAPSLPVKSSSTSFSPFTGVKSTDDSHAPLVYVDDPRTDVP